MTPPDLPPSMVAGSAWLHPRVDTLNQRAHRLRHQDARLALQSCCQAHGLALQANPQHGLACCLLHEGCRASEVVGRPGGEEFLLVLVETAGAPAHGLCGKLRQRVAAFDWVALHVRLAPGTVSIGLAALLPGGDLPALLGRADRQRYRAKQAGRNRVCGWRAPDSGQDAHRALD